MSFSMLYFSNAADAISTLSCCISSLISTFLMIAFGDVPVRLGSLGGAWPMSMDEVGVSSFSAMSNSVVKGEERGRKKAMSFQMIKLKSARGHSRHGTRLGRTSHAHVV